MKICPKCKTVYSSYAAACPRCGIQQPERPDDVAPAPKERVRRDWIWILVGVPAFIGLIYLILWIMKLAS